MAELPRPILRMHAALAALDDADDARLMWLAQVIRLWLAGAPWDDAAGLAGGWRDTVRARHLDAALTAILATLTATSCRRAADELAGRLQAYETSAWTVDRRAGRRPPGGRGVLYDLLAAGAPTSAERLRKLMAGLPQPTT
jgi:hypothetical protein